MKLVLLALGAALVLGATSPVAAQEVRRSDRPHLPAMRQDGALRGALFRGIELTEAQRNRIRMIGAGYRPQYEALAQQVRARRESGAAPDTAFRRELRTRVMTLAQRQRAEVRAVLTPEQQARMDANAAEIAARGEQRLQRMREARERRAAGERPRAERHRSERQRDQRGVRPARPPR